MKALPLLAGALVACLAVGVVALRGRAIDLSTGRIYTLSPATRQFLGGLDQDVAIEVFYAKDQPGYEDVAALVRRFADASSRISVAFLDPNGERAIALRLASGAVAVEADGEPVVVRNPDEADLVGAVAQAIGAPPPEVIPNVAPSQPLAPNGLTRALLLWLPVVVAPAVVAGLGVVVAVRRRAGAGL